jgi:hypothetical protein
MPKTLNMQTYLWSAIAWDIGYSSCLRPAVTQYTGYSVIFWVWTLDTLSYLEPAIGEDEWKWLQNLADAQAIEKARE